MRQDGRTSNSGQRRRVLEGATGQTPAHSLKSSLVSNTGGLNDSYTNRGSRSLTVSRPPAALYPRVTPCTLGGGGSGVGGPEELTTPGEAQLLPFPSLRPQTVRPLLPLASRAAPATLPARSPPPVFRSARGPRPRRRTPWSRPDHWPRSDDAAGVPRDGSRLLRTS